MLTAISRQWVLGMYTSKIFLPGFYFAVAAGASQLRMNYTSYSRNVISSDLDRDLLDTSAQKPKKTSLWIRGAQILNT